MIDYVIQTLMIYTIH